MATALPFSLERRFASRSRTWEFVPAHVVGATLLAVLGLGLVPYTVRSLWALWTGDALKSIGGLIPPLSACLILRAWRALQWESRGTWWGLVVLACTAGVVHLRQQALLELVLSPSWSILLPPHSVVAFAYGSGVVLLAGGGRLYRAAVFPIFLLLLVNPVPHAFVRVLDLPLQQAAAQAARSFAHLLRLPLSPGQLTLMFRPGVGMFIAPGCDGIRGSLTMGLLALVAGYLYRFRAMLWSFAVVLAVLLGYLFNLIRLCLLVLYYEIALHWQPLQGHAEMADYCIGAVLFFAAAGLFFAMIQTFGPANDLRIPKLRGSVCRVGPQPGIGAWSVCSCWVAWAALVALGSVSPMWALLRAHEAAAPQAQADFPANVGTFRLQRTWEESLATGQTVYRWAAYATPERPGAVLLGISPLLGAHDTLLCHAARGEPWEWQGSLALQTADGPMRLGGVLLNDGVSRYLEATTVCSHRHCDQTASQRKGFGLVYSRLTSEDLFGPNAQQPVPVLLRLETTNMTLTSEQARGQLVTDLQGFLAQVNLPDLAVAVRK